MTKKHAPARLVPAALILSAALMACNQQGTPPAGNVNALVLGSVQSPYLDALKPNLNLVPYTGSQKMDDYDLLVFDGDAQSPQTLQADPLVEQALRSGKWVLGLDVNEDHKRTGFADRLGAVNRGTSPGWMVRMGSDANGRSEVWIVDAPKVQAPLTSTPGGVVLADPAARLGANTSAYASAVMSQLRGLRAPLPRVGETPIPSNLSMTTYRVSYPTTTPVNATYKTSGTQTASAQYNYTYKVFLDNAGNPQGDFQWVSVEADVTGNPTSGTGKFANMTTNEKAWFMDRQTVSIKPAAADNSLFTSYASSPATANNVTTVTTGTTFTVGLAKDGPSASFTYSNEKTQSLEDWKLDNESSGNTFAWNYRSSNPIDADGSYRFPSESAFNSNGLPKEPNAISKTQLQLSTQGVWKTTAVLDRKVNFDMEGSQGLVDLFCPGDLSAFGTCPLLENLNKKSFIRVDTPRSDTLEIDMGSVVPVPIASVTFSPGASVQGGTTVTGTVTLSKPAKINTIIGLSSNSQNATVLDTVTIPAGQTSATFQVLTNTNGLAAGESTTATIQARYAQGFQAQLTVKR